jgi:hypothetical protein
MSQREIGPRVGGYGQRAQPSDDVDIQAFIERTPKTNEQTNREKTNTGWEYSFWVIVIIGIVIVLLILVVWFIFKKEEVTEVQRQIQPGGGRPHQQVQQQKQQPEGHHSQQSQPQPQPQPQQSAEENQEEKLARETRDNLTKKKVGKRDIGMVPGIIPDNPSVLGMKEGEPPKPESSTPAAKLEPAVPIAKVETAKPEQQIPDNLPDIQSTSVMSRLVSNFGLTAE